MRWRAVHLMLASLVVACAGPAGPSGAPRGDTIDDRTELERRQEAACLAVAERTTACAVADAKAHKREDLVRPEYERGNIKKFMRRCLATAMSSRQVRVFEVCHREETACEPFFACLDYAKPQAPSLPK